MGNNKETTAATVVSKETLQGRQNSTVAIELYKLIEDRDFASIQEISKTMYAIAINKKG
ncbi:hypothetical protein [Paenibacillus sp. FSL R5-808]|jgi:hypothetical protein|uniref:hypothetical protein n=1 Tax=unclassified Paenibacillus TaxID=185978 RepID=UPI0004B22A11|nr:hypothetical protein [Paenibacillus sp. FSL R5-808]